MKKSLLWIILGAAVLIVLLIILGKSRSGKGITVQIAHPVVRNITEVIPANGKIQPVTEVKISPDVSGEIVVLKVAEGDYVKAGQILLQIKQDQYISARDRMNAALNQAKAQWHNKKLSTNRSIVLQQKPVALRAASHFTS